MSIEIIEASLEQAALVQRVMRAAFAQYDSSVKPAFPAHRETLADVIAAMRAGGALLAMYDDEPIGSVRYRLYLDKFVIERVAVLPEYQGQGVASLMMEELEAVAAAYGYVRTELCSRLTLPRNIDFYRKRGYDIVTTDAETGKVTMMKWLVEQAIGIR
jgi:tRNA threonylcarbamoyladenosine biosynthesis protein TsaE